ncbi:hypothetical protein BBJ28_00011551 [Nothophytophthora sp. Chile5]|nr:hypothetical protein BBJ28_00011551 [Nothophytophthora sp. Chile5]
MGGGYNAYAYRDLDEEVFVLADHDLGYEIYQSPSKRPSPCSTLSESAMLRSHLANRRSLRTKTAIGVSFLLLVCVGAAAFFSSLNSSAWALTPKAMLRGTKAEPVVLSHRAHTEDVFEEEKDSSDLETAANDIYRHAETAEDEENDPYEEIQETGREQEDD